MHTWPYYSEPEVEAASAVLRSGKVNYWTGNEGHKFEKEFARLCGVKYAVAVANGTLALELALRVLEVGKGDEVIVPARTFIATASTVVNCGATPVFADVDLDSQTLTLKTIKENISPRTKAIIAVHLSGWVCDMDPILAYAVEHGIKVIEDCAQAHGASYKGRPVGSLGDVAAFSFCQDKIISTGGEGGMLVTNVEKLWKKAWSYKDHGKSYDAVHSAIHPPGYRWLHNSIGSNWRMTEMQAAIGRIGICKLSHWNAIRQKNAKFLTDRFLKLPAMRIPIIPGYINHAYYKLDVFIEPGELKYGWSRDRIMAEINANGVFCSVGSCPEVYRERAFQVNSSRSKMRLPNAKMLGETSLTFLIHPQLNFAELEEIACVVERVVREASLKHLPVVYGAKKELLQYLNAG